MPWHKKSDLCARVRARTHSPADCPSSKPQTWFRRRGWELQSSFRKTRLRQPRPQESNDCDESQPAGLGLYVWDLVVSGLTLTLPESQSVRTAANPSPPPASPPW